MYKIPCAFFFLLVAPLYLMAQITPGEGSGLNYRLIGFSFPQHTNAARYSIEIAAGNYNTESDFQKNVIDTSGGKKNKIIAQVPSFGAQYTWRIAYTDNHSVVTKSELHHFSTLSDRHVDSEKKRLRVLAPAAEKKDMFVFVDANKTLYDMDGNPVWYLPHVDEMKDSNSCHDLKYSCWGTITFMVNGQACEINYDGKLLWKEPAIGVTNKQGGQRIGEQYRSEFTHLANGHYMAIGIENALWDVSGEVDTTLVRSKKKIAKDSSGKIHQRILADRMIEFGPKHNIIWSWSATDYYNNSDLYYRRRANGLFQIGTTNENSFYFDEYAKTLYVSFGNINRIIKLKYPGGKVLNTYGQLYEPGNLEMNNDLFCGQNDCKRTQQGYLYMFNNNACNRLCDELPRILVLQEPTDPRGQLKKIWEYECTLDSSMNEEEQSKLKFKTGGSVFEFPDRSILCCMGGNYSKVFIVNRDKKILWSALPEQWNEAENKWKPMPGYRASIISRAELESIIWGEPLKK